jgi:hypothetical protein
VKRGLRPTALCGSRGPLALARQTRHAPRF